MWGSLLRLTREQRAAFFDGAWPRLKGEGTFPGEEGQVVRLSSRLAFRIEEVRTPASGGWSLSYTVLDQRPDRDRYLGPAPVVSEGEALTKRWHPDEELGYTGNPKTALADAGTCVDPDYLELLTKDSARRWALYRHREKLMEAVGQQQRALANHLKRLLMDAAKTGVDITPILAAAVSEAEKEIREAKVS